MTATMLGPAAFGFNPAIAGGGSGGLTSSLEAATVSPQAAVSAPPYSPDNPLFWFAVLLGGAAALVLFSGKAKVAAKASADADV